jgi:hypothetical protein
VQKTLSQILWQLLEVLDYTELRRIWNKLSTKMVYENIKESLRMDHLLETWLDAQNGHDSDENQNMTCRADNDIQYRTSGYSEGW